MFWITLADRRVCRRFSHVLSIMERCGPPYRKDATDENKLVLLDPGTEHLGSSPRVCDPSVHYGGYRLVLRVVLHASGCVALSRSHAEVKVSARGVCPIRGKATK